MLNNWLIFGLCCLAVTAVSYFYDLSVILRFMSTEQFGMWLIYFLAMFTIAYIIVMLIALFNLKDYPMENGILYDTELNEIKIIGSHLSDDDL